MKYFMLSFIVMILSSCGSLKTSSSEPDLGSPVNTLKLNISTDNIYQMLGLTMVSDSSKNLIRQLGKHTYSSSLDEYNPYARSDVRMYYQFDGIRLEYIGENAGSVTKETLLSSIKEFPNSFYLYSIVIEPGKYEGSLPKSINKTDGPFMIESKLGKHNEHFFSNNSTSHLKYVYPNHGLEIQFNQYPGDTNADSSIYMIIITDSVKEMEKYPTIYNVKK